ncbi:MAG: flagellar basal-body MS-ring/collar protein FliF, partial [Bdellovibrionota bacterium]
MASSFDPSAILAQLTDGYMKLPLVQKILFPVLLIASVSGIIFVSKWANRPEFVTLFSDLEPADSASVIERLKDLKVKYQVEGGGAVITISPPSMVHELRMTLAGEGIVQGGKVGLEIFEASNLGTTSFQERVKFTRAIQGELERTIESLDAVHAARVHIAQPEKSVFANKSQQPTASVMLRLSGRSELVTQQ